MVYINILMLILTLVYSCTNNIDCRTINNCNSVCINQICSDSVDGKLTCDSSEVCYEVLGQCFPKCYVDQNCSNIQTVLHYPNTGICDTSSNRCYDCLVNEDCKPYREISCNAQCKYNSTTLEYLCAEGNVCNDDSSCEEVSNRYECSNNIKVTNSPVIKPVSSSSVSSSSRIIILGIIALVC